MNTKDLSIIIVTYNSEKDIYDCLSSIYQYNDIGEKLEIIIVDNNSSQFNIMKSRIQAQYGNAITIINNKSNGGYGQGNNVGIAASTAPIIAVMNPDIRLTMPIFKRAIETLKPQNAIMCGGMQFYTHTQKALSFYPVFTLPPLTRFLYQYMGIKNDCYFYRKMWLQGAFFFVKKEEFMNIGGFDERIFMYGEEFDIHERLLKAFPNAKFYFLNHCKYIHLAGDRDFSPKQYEMRLRSIIYIIQKNGYSAYHFLKRERIYTMIMYSFTNLSNRLHHRQKRLPLKAALAVIDHLVTEYS